MSESAFYALVLSMWASVIALAVLVMLHATRPRMPIVIPSLTGRRVCGGFTRE